MRRTAVLLVLTGMLAACSSGAPEIDQSSPAPERDASSSLAPSVSPLLDGARLRNLSYTIISSSVRLALTRASSGFSVTLRDGEYLFPGSVASQGFRRVYADLDHATYGDVNHDGSIDAVVPLIIDQGQDTILEIAAVSASGSSAVHIASFPIGKATLKSLAVTDGKIRANFTQVIPGDPGPRNTELQLELPGN